MTIKKQISIAPNGVRIIYVPHKQRSYWLCMDIFWDSNCSHPTTSTKSLYFEVHFVKYFIYIIKYKIGVRFTLIWNYNLLNVKKEFHIRFIGSHSYEIIIPFITLYSNCPCGIRSFIKQLWKRLFFALIVFCFLFFVIIFSDNHPKRSPTLYRYFTSNILAKTA